MLKRGGGGRTFERIMLTPCIDEQHSCILKPWCVSQAMHQHLLACTAIEIPWYVEALLAPDLALVKSLLDEGGGGGRETTFQVRRGYSVNLVAHTTVQTALTSQTHAQFTHAHAYKHTHTHTYTHTHTHTHTHTQDRLGECHNASQHS